MTNGDRVAETDATLTPARRLLLAAIMGAIVCIFLCLTGLLNVAFGALASLPLLPFFIVIFEREHSRHTAMSTILAASWAALALAALTLTISVAALSGPAFDVGLSGIPFFTCLALFYLYARNLWLAILLDRQGVETPITGGWATPGPADGPDFYHYRYLEDQQGRAYLPTFKVDSAVVVYLPRNPAIHRLVRYRSVRDQQIEVGDVADRLLPLAILALLVFMFVVVAPAYLASQPPHAVEQPTADPGILQPIHHTEYGETGRGGPKTFELYVPYKSVLIVSGQEVDGQEGGMLRAYSGDRQITLTVTNGFYMIVPREYAEEEWCRLLEKAERLDWPRGTQAPLEGWTCE